MRLLFVFSLAAIILLSGCIDTPEDKTPAGMSIPVPIQRNYIQDSAINTDKIADSTIATADIADNAVNDSKLSSNAIVTNFTQNNTEIGVTGTTLINASTPGKITTNRTSALTITFSGQVKSGGISHAILLLNNVEQAPGTIILTGDGNYNSTSFTWYNTSIGAGTHNIWFRANTSAGTLNLLNSSLVTIAYPR